MHIEPSALKRIACDEDGGAYTLSYVMVFPIVMLLMCLIVESTLMLSAKLGTVYAAYVGARVASVWSSATDWDQAEQRVEEAAVKAFVPFASAASPSGGNAGEAEIDRYVASYEASVDKPVSSNYVRKKYANALASLSVTTDGPPTNWDADITVSVSYECPFRIPGIGRLLGEQGSDGGYYFPLTSEATLRNEGPQNDTQELGIGYGKLE